MCGNFNGDRRDDIILPNGERASNDAEFGNAWTSDISPPRCKNDTGFTEPCPKLYEVEQACGILTNRTGPFAECHWHESPAPYYESCVYDLCQYGPGNHMLCAAIDSYQEMCTIHGVKIGNWGEATGCARERTRGQARGCGRRGRCQELVTKPQPRAEPWLQLGQSMLGGTPSLLLCGGWPVPPRLLLNTPLGGCARQFGDY
ncbi:IgGFc-binding protein-like [Dermochelys coriacea]|uniref:IgGFc-binding protein-like n=1 Tax=Dermochelys coriacea TaxID=27794 RepID=UPI001CA94CAB|nr:IgGFc-binding protein-like [Dermochelys coriacea]